eukprot:15445632-Alexandrium_andersonii.AAC.1
MICNRSSSALAPTLCMHSAQGRLRQVTTFLPLRLRVGEPSGASTMPHSHRSAIAPCSAFARSLLPRSALCLLYTSDAADDM